jgi:hypothetical protein
MASDVMDPFWASLFEHLKHCGRSATLFILALAGLWFFLAVVIYAANLHEYLLPVLPGIVLLAAAWAEGHPPGAGAPPRTIALFAAVA